MEKTIVEKLNLKKYKKVAVLNMPQNANYLAELEDYDKKLIDAYDLIFAFVLDLESLRSIGRPFINGKIIKVILTFKIF